MLRILTVFFILIASTLASANAVLANADCPQLLRHQLQNDPRFSWQEWEHIERRAPNVFSRPMVALMHQPMLRLPKGLGTAQQKFYQGIFDLLHDRMRVFDLMQELKADLDSLPPIGYFADAMRKPNHDLFQIFRRYEFGFGIRNSTAHRPLEDSVWFKMINKGIVVMDADNVVLVPTIINEDDAYQPTDGHWLHGAFTHRLQLHLVLRELLKHPEKFGTSMTPDRVLSLYKDLGSEYILKKLDWSDTGIDNRKTNLYFELFDSVENNPSSAGYFYEYREYWPWLYI